MPQNKKPGIKKYSYHLLNLFLAEIKINKKYPHRILMMKVKNFSVELKK